MVSDSWNGRTMACSPEASYFLPEPSDPVTPLRLTDTVTLGGSPNSVFGDTWAVTRASPENETLSVAPFTEPRMGTIRTGSPAAAPRASRLTQSVVPIARAAMRTTGVDDFFEDIVRSLGSCDCLERRGLGLVRSAEAHALGRRNRRRQRVEERLPIVADLPAHEHGVVLVHRVVAVLHEHSAEVAELHGDGDAARGAEAVHVLAAALPRRHVAQAAIAGEDLAFLEVDVDRVIPATAAGLQGPDLAGPVLRSS